MGSGNFHLSMLQDYLLIHSILLLSCYFQLKSIEETNNISDNPSKLSELHCAQLYECEISFVIQLPPQKSNMHDKYG